ncbi:MAG: ABC transporter permease [bacterium]|nr:ABC transporter permease [bacterium]
MFSETLLQSALYVPLILGIFLSFRVLKLTDLTADGSFVLGAGIFARLTIEGVGWFPALLAALLGGFVVGLILAYIQKGDRVPSIVASILCVFMLYSVNMLVMGRPNISLLFHENLFSGWMNDSPDLFDTGVILFSLILMLIFIKGIVSHSGLKARAFGVNKTLLKRQGYHPEWIRSCGLGVSNSLYALSGVLVARIQMFSDVNMGLGVALIGIGSVIIGTQIFILIGVIDPQRFKGGREVVACLVGIFLYFFLTRVLLFFSLDSMYLKLVLGVVLTLTFMSHRGGVKNA